ncbi:MAG: hypothetical protein LBE36_08705 [Flavobacteriaceae bacterium]|jgi:hypothetical protein|nr:hypothetical protein [Flavobacteriaceae bacterium]
MIDFKKMDEKDFVFINEPWSEQEQKEFSEFIKQRKLQRLAEQKAKTYRPKTMRKKKELEKI